MMEIRYIQTVNNAYLLCNPRMNHFTAFSITSWKLEYVQTTYVIIPQMFAKSTHKTCIQVVIVKTLITSQVNSNTPCHYDNTISSYFSYLL